MWGDVWHITTLQHVVNNACYAHLWGYDHIFNTTWGFTNATMDRHWLNYGAWHRAPNIRDRIQDYDWILYGDVDYFIRDLTTPIQAILRELELYNKTSASLVLPADGPQERFDFSSFCVLIKNSAFGRRVLDHWVEMGEGLCPKGNFFDSVPGKYRWADSDQPGLWYALVKTYMEFFPSPDDEEFPVCNETTGFLEDVDGGAFTGKINRYFQRCKMRVGNYGADLAKVPDDQPIIWSTFNPKNPGPGSALGLQATYPKS